MMKACLLLTLAAVLRAAPSVETASPAPRKLVYSPYVNLDADMSAAQIGHEGVTPDVSAPMIGPFGHAPVPAFGLGGMMPQSLGLTSAPFNYALGQQAVHPGSGFNAGFGAQFGAQATQHHDLSSLGDLDDGIELNSKFDVTHKLALFDDPLNPADGVLTQCVDVQTQAIEISNAIMRKQNKAIFKELMEYLIRSKYLIAKTEIKMVRVLRQKIYGLMKTYSNVTEEQVEKLAGKPHNSEDSLDKEIDEEYNATDADFNDDSVELFTAA